MKLFQTFFLLLFTLSISAQLDIKTDLMSSFVQRPNLEAEVILGQSFGFGVAGFIDMGNVFLNKDIGKSGYRIIALGKHYFSPYRYGDRTYVGIYAGKRMKEFEEILSNGDDLGYNFNQIVAGLNAGYKRIIGERIIFDIDVAIGKTFSSELNYNDPNNSDRVFDQNFDFDGWLRVSLGYRLWSPSGSYQLLQSFE